MTTVRPRTPLLLALVVAVRRLARTPGRLWRRSLRVRTVLITLLLSSIALLGVGTVVSYTIAQGLFDDRRDQVLSESARAVAAAQEEAATLVTNDVPTLETAQLAAIDRIRATARPTYLWWSTTPGAAGGGGVSLPDAFLPEGSDRLVDPDLRTAMSRGGAQQWQSIGIAREGGAVHPGIVVGNVLQFGRAQAVLYLVYDIDDVQATLGVVQRSLLIGGGALLLLIAAVASIVASLVIAPLKQAAAVSEQLAAGRLDRRIPERGDDVVATLARSFNLMADSLQRQIIQLANLSRVQQRFVSDVSHELRTPLTTIRLASDVLHGARNRYDPPTARSAELLKAQVQRFEALLADLLEISRMDAQAADVSGRPTNLVDLARETIDALGGLTEETGSSIELIAPGGHSLVEVDERRIARIVRNLLANALEHGEGRPVVVTVDSSETAVALGVRDHGVGMPEADVQRVFDRFWRADPSRQRKIGGTGLGLAISLEDAVLHGGSLEVWSRRGDGTNFVLTLPRVPGVEPGRPVPIRPADASPEQAVVRDAAPARSGART